MESYGTLITLYLIGGVTFPLLLLALLLLHVHIFSPVVEPPSFASHLRKDDGKSKDHDGEDGSETENPKDASKNQLSDGDVAAGYFAVCREYVPGGVNGKPPERTTPAGAVVATESPSVYQTMYRSIFDRNKGSSVEPGKNTKRARNVFYVVLRYVTSCCPSHSCFVV